MPISATPGSWLARIKSDKFACRRPWLGLRRLQEDVFETVTAVIEAPQLNIAIGRETVDVADLNTFGKDGFYFAWRRYRAGAAQTFDGIGKGSVIAFGF